MKDADDSWFDISDGLINCSAHQGMADRMEFQLQN
jgi:hypothetical protein